MAESKILMHFFEEQREKYKKKVHLILHSVRGNHEPQPYDSEKLRRKDETESLSFHPFEIEPPGDKKTTERE